MKYLLLIPIGIIAAAIYIVRASAKEEVDPSLEVKMLQDQQEKFDWHPLKAEEGNKN